MDDPTIADHATARRTRAELAGGVGAAALKMGLGVVLAWAMLGALGVYIGMRHWPH